MASVQSEQRAGVACRCTPLRRILSGMSDAVARLNAALEGRYAIERELGEGGMATVYLADDLKHERKVALKVLKPELAAVVGAERFLAEITTTANLTHPHILHALLHESQVDGVWTWPSRCPDAPKGFWFSDP